MEGYGSNMASLFPVEIKFTMDPMVRNYYVNILPATLAIINSLIYSKLKFLEAKRNDLADTSARNVVLKRTNSSQASVMVQKLFPN